MAVLLTRAGYEVDAAPDGSTALRLFKQRPRDYDVLITDHEMPELDGLGLVEKLREADALVACDLTRSSPRPWGGLSFANAKAYAALHVDQILSKPITRNSLINAIRN